MIAEYLIIFLLFFLTVGLVYFYKKIAIYFNILANPDSRTLHEAPTPRGGGVIFSLIFVFSIAAFGNNFDLSQKMFYILSIGGLLATMFGLIDDIYNVKPKIKLIIQLFLSVWTVYWLVSEGLLAFNWIPQFILIPLMIFFMVWTINAYNFIDGIDGMAVSGAIFISLSLAILLILLNGSLALIHIFALIVIVSSGFIIFNWPPASIFMGDSGSVFYGYIFGSLILFTVLNNEVSIWSWLTVLGYFLADTTVTQIMRVFLVKKWYLGHRSHAYQNLARITNSHFKVTGGINIYNLLWVLPLTILSALAPDFGYITAILSIFPALIFSYKYGPSLSSS
jgi:Fuc2NAc and GlcNAc transferase